MDIITAKAEEGLSELLSQVQEQPNAWTCVHVNIAPVHAQALHNEGLTRESLAKIHNTSAQIAHKLMQWGLDAFKGSIFVFEDSDVLAVFKPEQTKMDGIISALRKEFRANGLLDILAVYQMQDRIADIVSLAGEKQEAAGDYRMKRRAIEVAESLSQPALQDAELTRQIQKKRRERSEGIVLIVEDDVLTRGIIASCLKQQYRVVPTKDAYSAIVAYIDSAPDVVFLDIELPDMSGHDILHRLKLLDPQAYIVMLTMHSEADNVLAARQEGAVGFIRKPFSKEKLLSYVMQCPTLSRHPTAKALGWRDAKPEAR